jgi:hypothetical protein
MLQVLSVLFILAPIGNILISFYGVGDKEWTSPSVFLSWLATIEPLDWFWLGLTFVTGILLFIQHKTAWLIAIINLVLILTVNVYRWVTTGELIDVEYSYFQTQILLSIIATWLTLGVIFYARYPYLDRRSKWIGSVAPRLAIVTPVTVVAQDVYFGASTNFSTSGVMVDLNSPLGSPIGMKFVDLIFPELQNLKIKAQIIHQGERRLRLRFRDLRGADKKNLKKWIETRS